MASRCFFAFVFTCNFLLSILSFAQLSFSPEDLDEIICCEQKASEYFLEKVQTAPSENYDLKYQRLEWTVNPDTLFISGKITSWFSMLQSGNQIYFDLSNSLNVYSVLYHFVEIPFSHLDSNILEITFPSVIPSSVLDSVSVFYEGAPDSSGFGSFEITPLQNGNCLWTLSEPYGSRDWWPCKQTLTDKIDSLDIYITCPIGYKAGTAGKLISSDTIGQSVTHHWKHRYPIATYLIGITVAPYEEFTNLVPLSTGSLEILNYVFPEYLGYALVDEPNIIPVIQFYDSLFAPYPFMNEKYGHMQFGWGGGMEHQTMSSMYNFGYELMAHELAHQWFGDMVTCAHWSDIWLNEGFATYLSGLCYEHFSPDIYWEPWKHQQVASATSDVGGSVFVDDTTSVSRIFSGRLTYRKGGYLLHMLRGVIGDQAFFTAVRNYLNDPQLKYYYATTETFKQHLESESGKNLDEFFDDWFYGEGYPSYHLRWSEDENKMVHVVLYQSTSVPQSVSFFEMPVTIRFKNASDSADFSVTHVFSGQEFTTQLSFAADTATIDPETWIISNYNTSLKVESPESVGFPIGIQPNPVRDYLYFMNYDLFPQSAVIDLYDVTGRRILDMSIAFPENASSSSYSLNVSDLAAGIYVLNVNDGRASYAYQIVKQ